VLAWLPGSRYVRQAVARRPSLPHSGAGAIPQLARQHVLKRGGPGATPAWPEYGRYGLGPHSARARTPSLVRRRCIPRSPRVCFPRRRLSCCIRFSKSNPGGRRGEGVQAKAPPAFLGRSCPRPGPAGLFAVRAVQSSRPRKPLISLQRPGGAGRLERATRPRRRWRETCAIPAYSHGGGSSVASSAAGAGGSPTGSS
jgi:hypothetical protein